MNNRSIQRNDLAGKTKLTAVNICLSPSRRYTRFVMLEHDMNGNAILPMRTLDSILRDLHARRGDNFTTG